MSNNNNNNNTGRGPITSVLDRVGVPNEARLMIAGALTAVGTYTSIAPLERVKILLQVQGMRGSTKYHGVLQTMAVVTKEEGFFKLWKGNGANVSRVVPNVALKFTFNDSFNNVLLRPGQSRRDMTFPQMLGAGTLAGLSQMCITYPIETIRTRLTLSRDLAHIKYRGIVDCFAQTVRLEGGRALYKGFGVSLLSGAPYVGIQMSLYAWLQNAVPPQIGYMDVVSKLGCGATAGVIAQSLMYPGDTLRRRMQTSGIGGESKVYLNTWDCTKKIVASEGWQGLYRGIFANTVKAIPNAGIQFVLFDFIKKAVTQ